MAQPSHEHSHAPATHAAHGAHGDAAHDVASHVRGYVIVGLTLFGCTILTVFLSYVDFGSIKANFIIAMIVATFKAGLVAAIFMHLLSERWTIYRVLILTVVFVLGLFLLTLLAWYNPIRIN
jgi:caa(3)-type oxidase subunit IV